MAMVSVNASGLQCNKIKMLGLLTVQITILVWCYGVGVPCGWYNLMTIHIADLGVEGQNGICIYDWRRERIPVGNSSYKRGVLIRVYRGAWLDKC